MFARLSACLAVAFCLSAAAAAEPITYYQVEGVRYDASVQVPEDAFGFQIGERPVRVDQMNAYLRSLADGSDRITVETIGYSHELRPIQFFVVTSPESHARLEEIREAHLARRRGEAAPADTPMVIWINYGVHGAETSSMDAAIPMLYHFAAAQGEAIEAQLDNAVILFTAVFNPDGNARRVDHVNTFWSKNAVTDQDHIQHDMWIEARTNHYWFDLNRQWLLLTQPEPRAWLAKWHQWKPMVSADYHEMGSETPYYFHPGEPNRLNPLIPRRARELTAGIADRHEAFMDSEARLYTSEERFDNFYVGKGSTYPQVNGGLGILFEAGAARGGAVETSRGLVTHADNIRTQFRTGLTTIQGALDLREEITDYHAEFVATARTAARTARDRAFVFRAPGDPAKAARFIDLLNRHDIAVHQLARDIRADGFDFPADDSFIVSTDQDQHRMIRSIFDRPTQFPENVFYDVSGWTMPLAYDLQSGSLSSSGFAPSLLGDLADPGLAAPEAPVRARFAYVFDWADSRAARALYDILDLGLLVRIAREPFTVETASGEVSFGRGSVIVPLRRQPISQAAIHEAMRTLSRETGVTVHAATTGASVDPGRDFGASNVFGPVEKPVVALAFDDGVSRYDAGEMWWTFDQQLDMPVTLRRKDDLLGLDWSVYTHLVLPGGGSALNEQTQERVAQWVREGGVLIATEQGASWAQDALLGLEAEESEDAEEETPRYDVDERALRDAEHVIGGAILAGDLDTSHPLGFGFADRELPLLRQGSRVLARPEDDPYAVPVQYLDEDIVMAGYVSEHRQNELAGTPAVVTRRLGQGTIVLIADNPVFRGTFAGSERLVTNAVFFSSLIQNARGLYDESED